ncbi:DUF805 domain-containing protein [Demequina salsinemoris]|uniref:DUF805 domain-containing protein n=1 Tax=Demequina salsinemoris TaxID=577470 RepID=UPI00078189AF|nr:DUF805 domain-containing protein [Demequina salsinemoris]
MSFGEAISTCFRKYTDFSGRARRAEYWWFYLFIQLVSIPVSIVVTILAMVSLAPVIASAEADGTIPESAFEEISWGPIVIAGAVLIAMWLVFFLPTLAVTIRRLHDTGRSGWWVLLAYIPVVNYVGSIVVFVFTLLDSEAGTNVYGPNPKGAEWGHIPMAPPPMPGGTTPPPAGGFQP